MKAINLTYSYSLLFITIMMLLIFFIIYYQGYKSLIQTLFLSENYKRKKSFSIIFWSICAISSILILFIFITQINLSTKQRLIILYPTYAWFFSFLVFLITRWLYNLSILLIRLIKILYLFIIRAFSQLFKTFQNTSSFEKIKPIIYISYLVFILFICIYSIYQAQSTSNIKINRVSIHYPNLNSKLKNLTITHLSDIHFGHFMKYSDFKPIADIINKINSDIFTISGDFISQSKNNIEIMEKSLFLIKNHKYGNYSSLGNHDHIVDIDYFINALSKSSTVLVNEEKFINIQDIKARIIGIDYPFVKSRVGGKLEQFQYLIDKAIKNPSTLGDTFNILISHHPDVFLVSSEMNIQLTLAGHSHGGQISFPGFNPIELFFDFPLGLYEKNGNFLYVNPGLSAWLPFRLNVSPEITVITIH